MRTIVDVGSIDVRAVIIRFEADTVPLPGPALHRTERQDFGVPIESLLAGSASAQCRRLIDRSGCGKL